MGRFALAYGRVLCVLVFAAASHESHAVFGIKGGLFGGNPAKPTNVTDPALQCYNNAMEKLYTATEAKAASDTTGTATAANTAATQLNAQGTAQTVVGTTQASSSASTAATCASIADAAWAEVQACPNQTTNSVAKKQCTELITEEFTPRYERITVKCKQNAAGWASTGASMNDMGMALQMMSMATGMMGNKSDSEASNFSGDFGGPGGGGTGGGGSGTGGGTGGGSTYTPPKTLVQANERTPAKAKTTTGGGNKANSLNGMNFGEEVEFAVPEVDGSNEPIGGGGGMNMLASGVGSPTSDLDATGGGRMLASLGEAAPAGLEDAAAGGGSGGQGGATGGGSFGFTPFDFKDPFAAAEAKPEEAKDANYLGKNKKQKASLAAMLAEKKKAEEEAKEAEKTRALASAKKATEEFKATPKSCAERKWQGKECQALKADPLLNIN